MMRVVIPLPEKVICHPINFKLLADHRKHFGIFEPFIGAALQSLTFAQYCYNGEPSGDDIGPLELGFGSSGYLLLTIASDGESVLASHDRLTMQAGFDLEDGARCPVRLGADGM